MRTCLDCNQDISHRANNSKRCEGCARRYTATRQKVAEQKYRTKERVRTRLCPTCGNPFNGRGTDYCQPECGPGLSLSVRKAGPKRPAPKKLYTCQNCGDPTANRFNCPPCLSELSSEYDEAESVWDCGKSINQPQNSSPRSVPVVDWSKKW